MKRSLQNGIRTLHLLAARALPEKIGVYLHDLPRPAWAAVREAVRFFQDAGYAFVNAQAICAPTPARAVFLSLDDNYRSWYEALDLFAELRVKATFYVNTQPLRGEANERELSDYVQRLEYTDEYTPLSRQELRAIVEAGHEVGAHTHSHRKLTALAPADAEWEIRHNKELLEDVTGSRIVHFSYPYGMRRMFSDELRALCVAQGMQTIASATPGLQFRGHRPLDIQRTPWNVHQPLGYNLENLRIDGRLFERLTGRSATPC